MDEEVKTALDMAYELLEKPQGSTPGAREEEQTDLMRSTAFALVAIAEALQGPAFQPPSWSWRFPVLGASVNVMPTSRPGRPRQRYAEHRDPHPNGTAVATGRR
jgi:hypothetical protein